ncbi:MAG: carbon monoxide dehydrogenase [Candidatus Marinimicrobia bacterium]|jgi:carbon monoxide dehydrogenase subunit G|nr:carbon monoxide dehydrogenase [Candidatus Neomarinimicrobiota bacterium]|tara:strand:+ start:223 stop:804 length:582 start_codon:yes stop_codon:yes gene_type:complete
MKVIISKTFSVAAPSEKVWDFMTNVEKVSTCIPGAEYVEDLGDGKHSVLLIVKVGPIKSTYRGEVFLKSLNKETQVIEIQGKGTDVKGKGGANMDLVGSIKDKDDNLTEVKGEATVTIQGMLAQFGSRMVEDVSNQLFIQFTRSLSSKLEGNQSSSESEVVEDNTLSGVTVASAAIKGLSGRFMDKIRGKDKT